MDAVNNLTLLGGRCDCGGAYTFLGSNCRYETELELDIVGSFPWIVYTVLTELIMKIIPAILLVVLNNRIIRKVKKTRAAVAVVRNTENNEAKAKKKFHIFKRKRSKHSEKTRQVETFNKYKQTMVGILTVKLLSDYENSIQEDFQDLRMDLQNHITEKHKTNERTLKSEFNDLKETLTTIEPKDGLKEYIKEETESLRQEIRKKQDDVEELKGEIRELKELVKMLADRGK